MWTDARGSFRNESFCAYDGDVTVNRFTAPKGQLDLDVEMQLPRLVGSTPKLGAEGTAGPGRGDAVAQIGRQHP